MFLTYLPPRPFSVYTQNGGSVCISNPVDLEVNGIRNFGVLDGVRDHREVFFVLGALGPEEIQGQDKGGDQAHFPNEVGKTIFVFWPPRLYVLLYPERRMRLRYTRFTL